MKKIALIGIAAITMLVIAEAAYAADYSLGFKLWANYWRETVHSQTGDSQTFDNGNAVMGGPSFAVKIENKWFANATYLTALGEYESSNWIFPGDTMKFKHTDQELRAGRLFHPTLPFRDIPRFDWGVFIGYKKVDAPASYTNEAAGFTDFSVGTWKQKGPGLGFFIDVPLNPSTSIYAELAFFWLKQEFRFLNGGQSQPFNAHGTAYEFGVARNITEALTANIGFKGEHTSGTEESGEVDENDFIGLIAGIAYGF